MSVDLVIVGASIRAAAFSALRAGFKPAGADLFADQDLAASIPVLRVKHYPSQLSRVLEHWPGTDWLYTGGLENHPRLVGEMARQGRLLGNSEAVLESLAKPLDLFQVLKHAGLPAPAVVSELPRHRHGWLRKPVRSAGGIGIQPARRPAPSQSSENVYYQKHVPGMSASAVFLATPTGIRLLGMTRQLVGSDFTSAAPYTYCGSIGPLLVPGPLLAEVKSMGTLLGDYFSLRGLFGIDLVIDDQQAWFIELNPRFPASAEIIERTTGQSLVGLHVNACRGESPELAPVSTQQQWGKAILYARHGLKIPPAFPSPARTAERGEEGWPSVADLPKPGSQIALGHPVLTVFAHGKSPGDVENQLREQIRELEQQILPAVSLATPAHS